MTAHPSTDSLPSAQRIASARSALAAAIWARGYDFPICNQAVIDLLADLRHFCAARHIDFSICDEIAYRNVESEIGGGQR